MSRTVVATVVLVLFLSALSLPAGPAGSALAQEPVDCSFPVTASDATGAEVTVPDAPDRVVVLGPSAAQQVWAIGADDRVVGMPVNEYTAYLDGRGEIEHVVGEDGQPVQEAVVGLEPDLVLAPNIVDNETVTALRNAGLTVYRYGEARSLADVTAEIETTGLLLGEFEAAARTSAEMQGTVEAIRTAVADADRPRVYYDLGGGWTAGERTFINDVIKTAGGRNIAAEAGIDRYATISPEIIAEQDPAVIVTHEGRSLPTGAAINNSTAMREGNVVRLDANFINQPGPRNVVPLERLASALHPDAMANASVEGAEMPAPARCAGAVATDGDSDGTTAADGTTPTPTGAQTTEGAAGPGFTATPALLALLLVGAMHRRRR